MIEKMFPQTVSNIIDYDAIKAAAKKYVEDVFVEIVKSFGDNLILQTMDEAHLAEVSKHVAGDSGLSVEDLLSYMNTDNIYRESQFVSDLLTAFPSGVEYLEFEVTGWKFPSADFAPFNSPERSYLFDGTPSPFSGDDVWMDNSIEGDYVNNLLLSRYKGQFGPNNELNWHKKSGRRSSWGDAETWMTTGGFGKPASIHINVDEERTVLEENGLSSVENWLGTVADKLPINLYIEINDVFKTNGEDTAGSTNGYRQSFPYAEGEGFCTNDPAMAVSPDVATVTYTVSYANTQLPDVQIELPESEIVEDGYSIILPTMTGEYESGGKTWSPTAWDIGAFGDSYTPSADTVAHLIFEEVETYEEITLYLESGSKQKLVQRGVTSGYTEDVVSGFCYQLYTDEACTIPWKGYDYSNDYEIGYYAGGEFVRYVHQSILDLPDAITYEASESKVALILLDTCYLWMCSNYTLAYNQSVTLSQITLRIYPKGQQVFSLYSNSSSVYNNTTIKFNSFSGLFLKPGLSGDIYPGNWPNETLIKVLGSAGNVVSEGYNDFNFATANGRLRLGNFYGSAVAKSVRCALLTFSEPVYYAELGGETYLFSGANRSSCRLYEKYPEKLNFEAGYSYKVIIPIALNGSATGGAQSAIDAIYFEPYSSTDQQAIIRTTSSGAFYLKAVWYIKTPIS